MSNVEVSIQIHIKPTEAVIQEGMPRKVDDGYFQLILDGNASCDIDALEDGLLRTNYPALRDALAQHLEAESKKKP